MSENEKRFIQSDRPAARLGAKDTARAGAKENPRSKRNLEEALKYVSRNWFPINTALFKQLQQKLKEGYYDDKAGEFLSDIKGDLSLFTYCLRRLEEVVAEEQLNVSPADLLMSVGIDRIKTFFETSEEEISMHKFTTETKTQAVCLRQAIISSNTAEALAEKSNVDSNLAFLCASVRQLGLNLVAWNYPRIYAKALTAIGSTDSDGDLDKELFKVLGYSPLQLGFKAALGWNQCPDILQAAGLDSAESGLPADEDGAEGDYSGVGKLVKHFCELGESVARINDPEHFPSAIKEWDQVVGEVNKVLGPGGLDIINEKISKSSASTSAILPGGVKVELSAERNQQVVNSLYCNRLLDENSFVKRCPEEAQKYFKATYSALLPSGPSPAAISMLVSKVVPCLGFTRGCVYLVDVQKMMAMPMLRIGEDPLSRYRPLATSDSGMNTHPVVLALSYSAPIVQEGAIVNGAQVSHITGVFGSRDKTGVLYLEMCDALASDVDRTVPLVYFKALRQCLNDCLNLR